MKKLLFVAGFLFIYFGGYAQNKKPVIYSVAFYNQENLFDTIHDSGKDDYEYLPTAKTEWNTEKYSSKLKNMAQVISQLSRDKVPEGPAVIGLSEIENRNVLEDLIKQPSIVSNNYQIIHYEGPDKRGIDCAFLYNPALFKLTSSKLVPYVHPTDTGFYTRGFLIAAGQLAGEKITLIVNHWPSRYSVESFRVVAGTQVKALKDSLLKEDPSAKIIIMGDMNDDPMDESMSQALGAKREQAEVEKGGLYNPWWNTLVPDSVGTLKYKGKWNLFDQIVVSSNLLGKDDKTLKYYQNEIFVRDFMLEQDGLYQGSPKRTFGSGKWLNGYSDHLPTIIYLIKK